MIIQVDNLKCKLIRSPEDSSQILRQISDYLSVMDPNRYFVASFRSGHWDGRYRLLTKANFFPTGLLPMVLKYCRESEVKVDLQDLRLSQEFPSSWDYTLNGDSLRDYQVEIVDQLKKPRIPNFYRGIADAATNAGKDYIMANLHLNIKGPTLLLINTEDVYRKAVKFFSQYFEVGEISSKKLEIKDFTVGMQKTVLNRYYKDVNIKAYIKGLRLLLVDEGHRAVGSEYQELITKVGAPFRYLFSGTPLDMDNPIKRIKLVGSFGPKLTKISNQFLIENKFSQKPLITVINSENWQGAKLTYRDEYEDCIMFNKNRNQKIVDICKNHAGEQILISFTEIKHGEEILNSLIFAGITSCQVVSGEDKERKEKIQAFSEGKIQVLISSMILKEGVNIPNIRVLILAHGGKSIITIKQYIGRALRHDGEHDFVSVYDFYDHGRTISQHSKARFKIYRNEGFEIKYNYKANKFGTLCE